MLQTELKELSGIVEHAYDKHIIDFKMRQTFLSMFSQRDALIIHMHRQIVS